MEAIQLSFYFIEKSLASDRNRLRITKQSLRHLTVGRVYHVRHGVLMARNWPSQIIALLLACMIRMGNVEIVLH